MTPEELAEVFEHSRRHARWLLRHEGDAWSLEATSLANEAYLNAHEWLASRDLTIAQAKAALATAVRHALIDHVRRKGAQKRGGEWVRVSLDSNFADDSSARVHLLDLERALELLAERDEEGVRLLEIRHWGGLSEVEAAEALGRSRGYVQKKLRWLHAWLRRNLDAGGSVPASGP